MKLFGRILLWNGWHRRPVSPTACLSSLTPFFTARSGHINHEDLSCSVDSLPLQTAPQAHGSGIANVEPSHCPRVGLFLPSLRLRQLTENLLDCVLWKRSVPLRELTSIILTFSQWTNPLYCKYSPVKYCSAQRRGKWRVGTVRSSGCWACRWVITTFYFSVMPDIHCVLIVRVSIVDTLGETGSWESFSSFKGLWCVTLFCCPWW